MDLSGWSVCDDDDEHIFTIPEGTILASGKYLVLCENENDFTSIHPAVPKLIGDLDFGLSNSTDLIRLYNAQGQLQLSICYDDSDPWTPDADGDGYTLELDDINGNLNDGANWFAGGLGGSPGGPYSPDCIAVSVSPSPASCQMTLFPNPIKSGKSY